jgi:hypothetical protein
MHPVIRRARRASAYVGRIPSALFGVAYLVTLLLFAALYTLLAREFCHTAIDKERLMGQKRASVRQSIEAAICKPLPKGNLHALPGGWYTSGELVSVDDVRSEDDVLIVSTSTLLFRLEHGELVTASMVVAARESDDLEAQSRDVELLEYSTDSAVSHDLKEGLYNFIFTPSPNGRRILEIPASALAVGAELRRASIGRATPDWNTFIRMLYFSAITITTVGYGDIVPVTTRTRLLVAIEAVFGVVLIGLFLNSIAHEARANDDRPRV